MEGLDFNILKEISLFAIGGFILVKLYEKKDTAQTNQNNELVNHLMLSNQKKDELLERTVANQERSTEKFEKLGDAIVNRLEKMDERMCTIETNIRK